MTSESMKKFHKEQEVYLECLGHLMGMEFEPKSGLKLKQQTLDSSSSQSSQLESHEKDVLVKDLSLDKSKTWRAGAATAVLAKFGISKKTSDNTTSEVFDKYVLKPPDVSKLATNKNSGQRNESFGLSRFPRPTFICPIKRTGNSANQSTYLNTEDHSSKRQKLESSVNQSVFNTGSSGNGFFSAVPNRDTTISNADSDPAAVLQPQGRRILNNKDQNDANPQKKQAFQTAYDRLIEDDKRKGIVRKLPAPENVPISGIFKRKTEQTNANASKGNDNEEDRSSDNPELAELLAHEKLKGFEPKIVESILSEVMEQQMVTDWEDIAGLKGPKDVIREIIIWPMLRPDIFKGLRASPKGILLFGPPGTGKTMIGRLIATKSNSTFFNISASSLTSKWIGDGEKMVRCLFQVARIKQPSVIFIDEIDSILTQRTDTEHESSRRMKTEFLIQFDGCGTSQEDKVLVIGVTNRPHELDEAARRRLVKRIYIPLPDIEGRTQIVQNLMQDQNSSLTAEDIIKIAEMAQGYSGADMRSLCQEASYGPIREIGHMLENIVVEKVRPIGLQDFIYALKRVKSSVGQNDLEVYEEWDKKFGCRIESD